MKTLDDAFLKNMQSRLGKCTTAMSPLLFRSYQRARADYDARSLAANDLIREQHESP